MQLDNMSITLILIGLIVFLYFMYGNKAISNSGALENKKIVFDKTKKPKVTWEDDTGTNDNIDDRSHSTSSPSSDATVSPNTVKTDIVNLRKKMLGKNHASRTNNEDYKHMSFKNGKRGGNPDVKLDDFFSSSAPRDDNLNDNFKGVDQADNLAQYIPNNNGKSDKDDIFNSNKLLPKDTENKWFDTYDNVKVKNAHLINVYRPIGANTVSGTLKNPTYDFRGDVVNPRYIVSPWNQSTIDPDVNNRGLCKS